jgi:sigma-E factor negative regulatory protein RseA
MSEQIREQVSAFLDGELPSTETELLLKRLTRDGELRESFGRYALIGEALRGSKHTLLTRGFSSRVNLAIDGEPVTTANPAAATRGARWWRPFAGVGLVAGVAAVAIVAVQQRSMTVPGVASLQAPGAAMVAHSAAPPAAAPAVLASNHEALSYTVPPETSAEPLAAPQTGRLTNYMFAHSKYSYGLGQRGVLADLLIEDDEPAGAAREPAKQVPVRVAP